MVENKQILRALKDIQILDKSGIKYLVIGSLICAASKGSFYRQVGDVDLICDLKDKHRIKTLFEKLGYKSKLEKPKFRLGFYWLDLKHEDNSKRFIAVVFGSFDKKGGWRLPLNKGFSAYLPPGAVKPTPYSIQGVDFIGFPKESAYIALTTISLLYANPKRKDDLDTIKDKVNKKIVKQIYETKLGFWWKNFYLPSWAILKSLVFCKNLFIGKAQPF